VEGEYGRIFEGKRFALLGLGSGAMGTEGGQRREQPTLRGKNVQKGRRPRVDGLVRKISSSRKRIGGTQTLAAGCFPGLTARKEKKALVDVLSGTF